MTLPRYCPAGATYLVTRRCFGGSFFLVPRPWIRRLFGYCLALAANRYDISLHGFVVRGRYSSPSAVRGLSDPDRRLFKLLKSLGSIWPLRISTS